MFFALSSTCYHRGTITSAVGLSCALWWGWWDRLEAAVSSPAVSGHRHPTHSGWFKTHENLVFWILFTTFRKNCKATSIYISSKSPEDFRWVQRPSERSATQKVVGSASHGPGAAVQRRYWARALTAPLGARSWSFQSRRKPYGTSPTPSGGSEGGMGKTGPQEEKGKHFTLVMRYFLFSPEGANTSGTVVRSPSKSRALQGCNISPWGFGLLKCKSYPLCEAY